MNIAAWLESLGLGEYAAAFAENRIGPDVLPELADQDLRDLGIAALGDRKRLLAAIAALGGTSLDSEPPAATPGEGERRQVTVLFADIAGFTPLSERLGAEDTHEILNRYFEAADRIVEEFGGAVDKHIGDNVMAVFGAPVAHDNDPERAVRAALAIHEAARGIEVGEGTPLTLHIGIASGQVVASGTGSDSHREYTVTGDSVNLAARLQGLAAPGQTLVSEAVQRHTSGLFSSTGLGPQTVRGIARPVVVHRIEGLVETVEHAGTTPFVGRRSELGQCRAILAEVAATGEGQAIILRGAAGIGKTRLAAEILRAGQEAGYALHRCLVLDFGSRKGQDAIPALVRSLLGLPSGSDKIARAKAADAVLAQGAYAEEGRVFLNDLLDLPQPLALRRDYDAMDDAARRAGRRALVAGLVAWASRAQPRLILVEDLHWADAQTLDTLSAVLEVAREHPVAFLATTRPEGDPLDAGWRAIGLEQPVSIINLGPLRASEAQAMAEGFARANRDRLAECLERAAGNPLFLEQLLQNVAESASALVPGTIQSLVLARMDRLEAGDRKALQAASVFGQRVPLAALRHLLDDPAYDCAGLLRHRLVRPEGDDFLFTHALIRDGVYESILTAARARLHRKAAAWFEGSDIALRAEHLQMAGDAGAARAYLEAARAELAKYHYAQALALLEKGRPLATEPQDRAALALAEGEARLDLGQPGPAGAAFRAALAAAEDEADCCHAHLGLAAVKRIVDDLDGALADIDSAEAVAQRLGLAVEESRAHFLRGNILFPRGDVEGCLREHETALALARAAGSAELEAAALGGLADAEYLRGRYRTACARFTECVETARTHGFGRIEVANLPMIGITAQWSGDAQRAYDVALEAVAAAQRVGHGRAEMIARHAASLCCKARAEFDAARDHIQTALDLSRALGARRFEAEAMLFAADIDYAQGRRAGLAEIARQAVAISRQTEMAYMGPMILGVLALVTDDPAERRAATAEAETLLAAGSISHNHLFFRCSAIEASLQAGEPGEAERHVAELVKFCPEGEVPLGVFYAARGAALARALRGERSAELAAEIDRLIADGESLQQESALAALRDARAEIAAEAGR